MKDWWMDIPAQQIKKGNKRKDKITKRESEIDVPQKYLMHEMNLMSDLSIDKHVFWEH